MHFRRHILVPAILAATLGAGLAAPAAAAQGHSISATAGNSRVWVFYHA